jgi:4-hydroxybenzoate polyprenyltransferase
LKRHHITAAFCIVAVRGVLVNLAIGAELDRLVQPGIQHWPELVLLAVFVSVFSLAIAWFKDLYDTKGDAEYQIRTFPLLYSARYAFIMGNILVMGAYLLAIVYGYPTTQLAIEHRAWHTTTCFYRACAELFHKNPGGYLSLLHAFLGVLFCGVFADAGVCVVRVLSRCSGQGLLIDPSSIFIYFRFLCVFPFVKGFS